MMNINNNYQEDMMMMLLSKDEYSLNTIPIHTAMPSNSILGSITTTNTTTGNNIPSTTNTTDNTDLQKELEEILQIDEEIEDEENNDIKNLTTPIINKKEKKYSTPLTYSAIKSLKMINTTPPFYYENNNNNNNNNNNLNTNLYDSTDVTHTSIKTEPINNISNILIEHLDLLNFKSSPCQIMTQHNHKHCPYYHNYKDRKRIGNHYSADLCEYIENDIMLCKYGDNCNKAHNRVEQLYRPDKYKTKFCTFYPNNINACDYGIFCSFAHSENDITIELIHNYEYDDDFYMFHFKTVWCPFNLTQHDKALCVYAHNWQDYRRKPHIYNYDPTPCSNWKSTDFIVNYEDGCPQKEKCNKCHGWKENEYHPLNYKTKQCPMGKNCQKGKDCAHYHNLSDKRVPNINVYNKIFRYIPRNRVITGTFKRRHEDKNQQVPNNNNNNGYPLTLPIIMPTATTEANFNKKPQIKGSYTNQQDNKGKKNQINQFNNNFGPLSLANLFQINNTLPQKRDQNLNYLPYQDKSNESNSKNDLNNDQTNIYPNDQNSINDEQYIKNFIHKLNPSVSYIPTQNTQKFINLSDSPNNEEKGSNSGNSNNNKKCNRERSSSEFLSSQVDIPNDNMNSSELDVVNKFFNRKWSNDDETPIHHLGLEDIDKQFQNIIKFNVNEKPKLKICKPFIPSEPLALNREPSVDQTVKQNIEKLFENENY